MTIIAAADGSALGNPGPAGWAWYVDDGCWAAGGWKHATNNQGELTAVLELFRATAHVDDDLLVLCDSQYVINSVTKWMPGWKRKGWRKADGSPVMNRELLQELDAAIAGRSFTFEWVKGHVGHELNEAADARARAVAEAYQRGGAVPSGPGFTAGHTVSAPRPVLDPAAGVLTSVRETDPLRENDPAAVTLAATETNAELVSAADSDTLFSLDEASWHQFTLSLTREEHERLLRRARDRGVSPEELLRTLI